MSIPAHQSQRSGYRTASHEQCRPLPGCHSPSPVRDLELTRRSSVVGPPIHREGGLTQATVHNANHQRPSGSVHAEEAHTSRDLQEPVTLGGSNDLDSNRCTEGTSLIIVVECKHSCPANNAPQVLSPPISTEAVWLQV